MIAGRNKMNYNWLRLLASQSWLDYRFELYIDRWERKRTEIPIKMSYTKNIDDATTLPL